MICGLRADHEGDGDRLAHRPPEAEHDGTDDAALAVGEHRAADHLPPRRAQRRGALPSRAVGVVSITSRVSEVMIGMIMMARMRPAVKNERPLAGSSKSWPSTGMRREARWPRRVEVADRLGQHEDAPQAEDDRRHDGEQVEHVRRSAACSQRGATSVMNRAMPMLTRHGEHEGDDRGERACRRRRRGAEHARRAAPSAA